MKTQKKKKSLVKGCGTCIKRKDCKIDNVYGCFAWEADEVEISEREKELI